MSYASSASSPLLANPTIFAAGTQGLTVQSADISPIPTFRVKETTTGCQLLVIPNSDGNQYNPLDTTDSVELVGSGGRNNSRLALVAHCDLNCGIRLVGVTDEEYVEVGCGGMGANPTNGIRCTDVAVSITCDNLVLNPSQPLATTAGAVSGKYLTIYVGATPYKIALLADSP